jgi:hypothetical protein
MAESESTLTNKRHRWRTNLPRICHMVVVWPKPFTLLHIIKSPCKQTVHSADFRRHMANVSSNQIVGKRFRLRQSSPCLQYEGIWRNSGIAPPLLNLSIRCRWEVNAPNDLPTQPWYPLNVIVCGQQSRCRRLYHNIFKKGTKNYVNYRGNNLVLTQKSSHRQLCRDILI